MLSDHVLVALAEAMLELCRALDVRKEERDRTAGQIAHVPILTRRRARRNEAGHQWRRGDRALDEPKVEAAGIEPAKAFNWSSELATSRSRAPVMLL